MCTWNVYSFLVMSSYRFYNKLQIVTDFAAFWCNNKKITQLLSNQHQSSKVVHGCCRNTSRHHQLLSCPQSGCFDKTSLNISHICKESSNLFYFNALCKRCYFQINWWGPWTFLPCNNSIKTSFYGKCLTLKLIRGIIELAAILKFRI